MVRPVEGIRIHRNCESFHILSLGAFTWAGIAEFERFCSEVTEISQDFADFKLQVETQIDNMRTTMNLGLNMRLTDGQKTALAIIAANIVVALAWRVPQLQAIMWRYFTNSYASKSLVWPMLNSVFSHISWIHLGLNMYVLFDFAPVCVDDFLGKEQFLALYITAGLLASFGSLVHKCAVRSNMRAVGASGAIYGVLAYTSMKIPDAQLSIIFLPMFTFSAQSAIFGVLAFDTIGLLARWRLFDHAAHLGGTLFGV
ncbi:rhomboid family protein [Aphelenchoides avenae]|nr:rhomboid family protein [Aphelenchus avenae]